MTANGTSLVKRETKTSLFNPQGKRCFARYLLSFLSHLKHKIKNKKKQFGWRFYLFIYYFNPNVLFPYKYINIANTFRWHITWIKVYILIIKSNLLTSPEIASNFKIINEITEHFFYFPIEDHTCLKTCLKYYFKLTKCR